MGPRPLLSEPIPDREYLPALKNGLKHGSRVQSSTGQSSSSMGVQEGKSYKESTKLFSITIIRRDPSSGAQWNVGKVLGEGQEPTQKSASSSKKPFLDMSVHLTTPGYTQFRNTQGSSNTGENGIVGSPSSLLQSVSEPGFDRQMRMEGSNFWDRPKKHIRSHSDVGRRYGRNASLDDNSEKSSIDYADSAESGTKGYAFGSPWVGGRCKFSTSSSGRTLRCKHTIPGPVSASIPAESGNSSHASVPVSELRFNLPSLTKFHGSPNAKSQTNDSGRFQMPKIGHIRNKLSPEKMVQPPPKLPPRPHPTSYASMYPSDDEEPPPLPPRLQGSYTTDSSDEEEDRLDLSIGQEKAGGGNRGKRAKLGKLIILDEGFKMLDLIVAANMGIWWSVWEPHS